MSILYKKYDWHRSGHPRPGYTKWVCDHCGVEAYVPVLTPWGRYSVMQPIDPEAWNNDHRLGSDVQIEWHLCPDCCAVLTDFIRGIAKEPIVIEDI